MLHHIAPLFQVVVALLLLANSAAALGKTYPNDPFAPHYRLPKSRELGTTAQQIRASYSVGAQLNKSAQLLMQVTGEFMTWSFLGIRLTALFTVHRFGQSGPRFLALRVGPSVHVIPHSRVDLAFSFEAGPQNVHPFSKSWMPVLAGAMTFTVSLSSYWFLQLEGQASWGVYSQSGASTTFLGINLLAGVGVQI